MTSPTKHIRDYLTELDTFWPIYIGSEPTTPNDCITLYDTGGGFANRDAQLSDSAIQIRVRSFSYADGYDQAAAVRDALIDLRGLLRDNWFYTGFWLTMDVAKIGRDDADRELFTVNLRAMRQPVETLLAASNGAMIQTSDGDLIKVAA